MFSFCVKSQSIFTNNTFVDDTTLILITHFPVTDNDQFIFDSEWEESNTFVNGRGIVNLLSHSYNTVIL